MSEIQHNNESGGGSFFLEKEGEKKALMTYTLRNENLMVIDHTEVDDSLQGKGIGEELVASAVKYTRENGIKILPECSYAKHVMEKDKSFRDVLEGN